LLFKAGKPRREKGGVARMLGDNFVNCKKLFEDSPEVVECGDYRGRGFAVKKWF
jgi:hypothetical protein